jgi:hypothetical protein
MSDNPQHIMGRQGELEKMSKAKKVVRNAKSGRSVGGYEVLGYTDDGVQILKPKGKPKSFTIPQLKKAIAAARAKSTG